MPFYAYRCNVCDQEFDRMLPISQYADPQTCPDPECGGTSKKLVVPVGFILSGDDWPSKAQRINKQMAEKNRRLAVKETDVKRSGAVPSLVPNVGGEQVDTWTDAKKLAASKGKDTSGYEKQERKVAAAKVKPAT